MKLLATLLIALLPFLASAQRIEVSTGLPGILSGPSVGDGQWVTNISASSLPGFLPQVAIGNIDGASIHSVSDASDISALAFSSSNSAVMPFRFGTNYSTTAAAAVSTYTAWFNGIGTTTNEFNSVRLYVTNWATSKPTQFRAVIRQQLYEPPAGMNTGGSITNPTTWPIIIDSGTVNISLTDNSRELIVIPFSQTIITTNFMFLQVAANGRWMPFFPLSPSPTNGVALTGYNTSASLDPTYANFLNSGGPYHFAFELGTWDATTDFGLTPAFAEKVAAAAITDAPAIALANQYACAGDEFNLYFRDVIRHKDLAVEDVDVVCGIGAQYADYFRATPATTDPNATNTLSLYVLDGTNYIASSTKYIFTAANTNGQGVSRKVLIVGDSTTAGGHVITELTRRGGTNGFALTGIGTQGTGTNMHEGRPGWSVNSFYAGASSPMTNSSGAFDFNYYLTNNSLTMASNDWVIINLGINDVFSKANDAEVRTLLGTMTNQLAAMVTNIQFAVPGCRVAVVTTIGPSASQDAFGDDYGQQYTLARYRRNRSILNERMAQGIAGATTLPLSGCLDTVYNMAYKTVAVNARNATTREMMGNGLHPAESGYLQIADQIYAFLKWWEK